MYFLLVPQEAFDYIGSQRLVYDMLEDKFPWDASKRAEGPPLLKPTDIVQFLEMGQVALLDEGAMWAHTDPLADTKPQVRGSTTPKLCLANLVIPAQSFLVKYHVGEKMFITHILNHLLN